jgi:4-hydroxy-L-threonine phosphate dehydrogenase PdxA
MTAATRGEKRPVVAVSVGCASGVGPEVAVAAAAKARDIACVLVGDLSVILRAAMLRKVSAKKLVAVDGKAAAQRLLPGEVGVWIASRSLAAPPEFGRPTRESGAAQLAWIDEATDLVRAGIASALVTGPVSKHAIATSGAPGAASFRGHTEHLAERLGAREVIMAFRSEAMTTSLATTHLPLGSVPAALTPEAVERATYWLVKLLRDVGIAKPRVAVAALNPHAGEQGLLGTEEQTAIGPGIARAKKRLAKERSPDPSAPRRRCASTPTRRTTASWRCTTIKRRSR